jgi:hypothetical protein
MANFSSLEHKHVLHLPAWGPYWTKCTSHLPDLACGVRFDLGVFLSGYRRQVIVHNPLNGKRAFNPGKPAHHPFLLRNSSPDEIKARTLDDFKKAGQSGGLTITTAGSLPAGTGTGRMLWMMQVVQDYCRYG